MRKARFFFFFLFLPLPIFSQETITITTYYPAPYGVYRVLRLHPTTAIDPTTSPCNTTNEGDIFYYNFDNTLYFCDGSNWQSLAGFWTQSDSNLYPNDPAWNVGIGTTNPAGYRLRVAGTIGGDNRFSVSYPTTNVYDDATSNSPYSRVNADSLHTNGLGVGQIFIEGRAIDANTWIAIGNGLAGGQSPQDVKIGNNNEIYVDTSTNRVGIGTASPTTKLDINGQIRIRGGSPADGRVLTSDADGLAVWDDFSCNFDCRVVDIENTCSHLGWCWASAYCGSGEILTGCSAEIGSSNAGAEMRRFIIRPEPFDAPTFCYAGGFWDSLEGGHAITRSLAVCCRITCD
jgi:hypothetical protein